MQVYGAPFGIAFIVTVMISLFSGVLVGFISLRIEGIYLAILTLGLSEILRNTFISLKSSIKLDMSKVRLFGVKIGEEQVYLLILALFVLLLFITSNLIRSPIGRALLSVKNSTSAAQAMGINLMKYRVLAFVISTVYAAIAGLMYMDAPAEHDYLYLHAAEHGNLPEHFRRCGHRRSQVSMGHHLRSVHHLRTAVNAPEQDSLLRGEPGVHYHDYGSAYHPHRNVLPWRHSSNDGEPYEKEKNSKIRCQYAKEGGRLWPELTERTEK